MALIFKLVVLGSLQQVYEYDDTFDISCQVFLNTHVPQVFLTMGIMVMLVKTRIFYLNTKDTAERFRELQKKRRRRSTNLLRILYVTSYVILAIRYIGTCNSGDESNVDPKSLEPLKTDLLTFEPDHQAYSILKIIFLMLISVYMILIRQSPYFTKHRNSSILVIISLLASIATEIISLILVDNSQSNFKNNIILYNCLFLVDFVLIGFLTYAMLAFRGVEVQIMLAIGIFKDIKDMNDQEMF